MAENPNVIEKLGFKGFTLIIEVKINFSLRFDNTDYRTNKLQFLQMEQAKCTPLNLIH